MCISKHSLSVAVDLEQLFMSRAWVGFGRKEEGVGWGRTGRLWCDSQAKASRFLDSELRRETCTLEVYGQEECMQVYHHKVKHKIISGS